MNAKIRLRSDRRLSLALDISYDVVESGHRDLELAARQPGHLRHRIRRRLQRHFKAVGGEKAQRLRNEQKAS